MANMYSDTDSTDRDIQYRIACALSKLNRQRIYLSNIAAEDQSIEDVSAGRKIHYAQEAVNASRKALYVFVGLSDEQAATFQVLETLLAPLDLPEASEDDVQAWRESRLRNTTNAELSARTQAVNNDTIVGRLDTPALSQAVNSDSSNPPLTCISKLPKEQKTWTTDYAGVEFLTISPTIIKLQDETFVELRCDLCNGNGSHAHHKLNKGVRGFHSHLRQARDDRVSAETAMQRCIYRVVSSQEVERLKTGDEQIEFIPCKAKGSLGNGVEYIGNTATVGPVTVSRAGHTVETLAAAGQTQPVQTASLAAPKKKNRKRADPDDDSLAATSKTRNRNRIHDATAGSAPCLSNCPVVVKPINEAGTAKYHELRCDVCGGNGSYGGGKLLQGIKGFKAHFHQIHNEQLLTSDILSRCSYREVPLQEVQQIQNGTVDIGFIRCAGSATVRPRKSYKGFNTVERP